MTQDDKLWEIRVEAAARSMEHSMFAKHELPVDEELHRKYRDTAAKALQAANIAVEKFLHTIT